MRRLIQDMKEEKKNDSSSSKSKDTGELNNGNFSNSSLHSPSKPNLKIDFSESLRYDNIYRTDNNGSFKNQNLVQDQFREQSDTQVVQKKQLTQQKSQVYSNYGRQGQT